MNKSSPSNSTSSDFAPGLLAIQENPPSHLTQAVMYAVSLLFLALLTWSFFGKLDIIASAEGRLVPQSYVKIVQPADAGIVREILVREGEKVEANQVLIRMDMSIARADQASLTSELALKSLQLKRTDAELSGQPLPSLTDIPQDLYSQVSRQYVDRRQLYTDAVIQARHNLEKARQELVSGKEVLAKLREVTPIIKQQAESYADMGKDGYVPQITVRDKQREYLEKAKDLSAQEAIVASLVAAVAAAEKQVAQITSKYRSDLRNEQVEAEGQYRKLEQEWLKQKHKSELLELRAPQAGTIKDLATHTIGTVTAPGSVLLSLVPENEPLIAEVMVKNDDVGFVFPQQTVKVKLTPYPFEKYGMLEGEVIHVGADANMPESNTKDSGKAPPPVMLSYKALIALKTQTLETQGEKLKLAPGMQVVAEINQGRRSVLEYLLSPVRKTLHESGRER